MKKGIIIAAVIALVLIVGLSSVFTVQENQYACTD